MGEYWQAVVWSILPTIVVVTIGVVIFRGITRFDRNERKAYAKVEAEERARRGMAASQPSSES